MTLRLCLPEPACDCLMVTSSPLSFFHSAANAVLKSRYSSRVGS